METNPNFKNTLEYRKARRQAREIRGFYIHLTIYCIVIPVIIAINFIFVPDFYWFPFTVFGWGTGLLFHFMEVKKFTPFMGKGWEDKKIQELMDKEKSNYEKFKQNQ